MNVRGSYYTAVVDYTEWTVPVLQFSTGCVVAGVFGGVAQL